MQLPKDERESVVFEAALLFVDLSSRDGVNCQGNLGQLNYDDFKVVSRATFRLHNMLAGIHEYLPVVFDEYHFCLAKCVIHTSIVDVRIRLSKLPPLAASADGRGEDQSPSKRNSKKAGYPDEKDVDINKKDKPEKLRPRPLSLTTRLLTSCPPPISSNDATGSAEAAKFVGKNVIQQEQLQRSASHSHEALDEFLASVRKRLEKFVHGPCNRAKQISKNTKISGVQLPNFHELCRPKAGEEVVTVSNVDFSIGVPPALGLEAPLRASPSALAAAALLHPWKKHSLYLLTAWEELLNKTTGMMPDLVRLLNGKWRRDVVDRWGESIFRETCPTTCPGGIIPSDKNIGETHSRVADTLRSSTHYQILEQPDIGVEDLSFRPRADVHPVLFEQRYILDVPGETPDPTPEPSPRGEGEHLFVLVHGFQGNNFDMRLLKNHIALVHPTAHFLCSICNEDQTDGDISSMGERLAEEVRNYISDLINDGSTTLSRLSFVGHSLGGLIARAALPLLSEFRGNFHSFLCLSTPHLGCRVSANRLVDAGIWVLKQWKKSVCLKQLTLEDHSDPRQCYLYRLSATMSLKYFNHVVLVSSYQDQYSPFDSSRVEVTTIGEGNENMTSVYQEMAEGIVGEVELERLIRFDVNFRIPEQNLNTFIGRAAHIQFLECQPLMKMFVHTFAFLFT